MNIILHIVILRHHLIRILTLGFFSLAFSLAITPLFTTLAYRYKWWRKTQNDYLSKSETAVPEPVGATEPDRNIPTMAGIIFVLAIAFVTLVANLNRGQTWLPLAGMLGAGLIGLIDDVMSIRVTSGLAGMKAGVKLVLYSVVALIGGWWFYDKLGVHAIYLPYVHHFHLGILVIGLFWLVVLATAQSVNITDSLAGLSGGLLTSSFTAYALICILEGKYGLAGFCITVVGAILSYTWFNISPARFFMGDVGSFALGTALGIIAMQTNTLYVLPLIGAVYVLETGSVIVDYASRKLCHGKSVFLASPLHRHFEAKGWPQTKVAMRFWILGQVAMVLGLIVFLERTH